MKIRFPYYMKQFRCAAGDCADTCCKGWEIAIDRKTLARYRKESGRLGPRFREGVDFKAGVLRFSDGVCPFLDSAGLCGLQKEHGAGMLCAACRLYPRHAEEYGDRREWSLSLSCPEAVELVLAQSGPTRFIEREVPGTGRPEGEVEENLLCALLKVRDAALEAAQEERIPLELRMALVLALARDVQRRLGAGKGPGRLEEIPELLRRLGEERERLLCSGKGSGRFARRIDGLRVSEKVRRERLLSCMDGLAELSPAEGRWPEALDRFYRAAFWTSEKEGGWQGKAGWREDYGKLFVSWLDLYLPGAVYDRDLLSKAKLAVFHCLAVRNLEEALGEPLNRFLHIYVRETEHLAENLERLEGMLREQERFRLPALLSCVLPPV